MLKNKLYKYFLIFPMFALLSSCVKITVVPKGNETITEGENQTVTIHGTISE
jgi:hypothetical protein